MGDTNFVNVVEVDDDEEAGVGPIVVLAVVAAGADGSTPAVDAGGGGGVTLVLPRCIVFLGDGAGGGRTGCWYILPSWLTLS